MLNLAFDGGQILSCFLLLFTIIDMIGNTPVIISLNKDKKINPLTVATAVGVIFISFLFLGKSLLNLLHVDINSFAVAGSIVLFIIALELILGIDIHKNDEQVSGNIVPLAFPLIAGPGSLTMLLTLQASYQRENIIAGVLINVVFIFVFLKFADFLGKYLSPGVLSVVKKVFGVVLLAISIKIFGDNAPGIFHLKTT